MQCVCPVPTRSAVPRLLRESPNAAPESAGSVGTPGVWSPRQESNLYLALRRRSFYPLNYGGMLGFSHAVCTRRCDHQRHDQIRSMAFSSPDFARSVKRWAIRYTSCQLPVVALTPRS
jgi:hypothetical protein